MAGRDWRDGSALAALTEDLSLGPRTRTTKSLFWTHRHIVHKYAHTYTHPLKLKEGKKKGREKKTDS